MDHELTDLEFYLDLDVYMIISRYASRKNYNTGESKAN
jgi:hypothetical protein